jgi:hypothetical protein
VEVNATDDQVVAAPGYRFPSGSSGSLTTARGRWLGEPLALGRLVDDAASIGRLAFEAAAVTRRLAAWSEGLA